MGIFVDNLNPLTELLFTFSAAQQRKKCAFLNEKYLYCDINCNPGTLEDSDTAHRADRGNNNFF